MNQSFGGNRCLQDDVPEDIVAIIARIKATWVELEAIKQVGYVMLGRNSLALLQLVCN